MSQAVPDLANQLSASLRTNLNLSLKALNSLNSGVSEPTYSYANMLWYDTSSNILKMKPEDNAAGQWISIGYFDQSTDTFKILDDTVVTTAAGVDTDGIIGDQSTATWQAGTGTTESLVSPAKVKASVESNSVSVGLNQTWQDVAASRSIGTSYQNTTGKPIFVSVSGYGSSGGVPMAQVSVDGSTWISVVWRSDAAANTASFVVPNNSYYRIVNLIAVSGGWAELR